MQQQPPPPPHARPRVRGESLASDIAFAALVAAAAAATAAGVTAWGWLMAVLAWHLVDGFGGVLELCTLVIMGGMAVATLAGLVWALLQAPTVRRYLH